MFLIQIALALTAIYCGGMWLYLAAYGLLHRDIYRHNVEASDRMERFTFHLGLCFILAAGFLALILE